VKSLEELDRLAATEILGARKISESNPMLYIQSGTPDTLSPLVNWQPTRNISQAWGLLEKFERYTVMTWNHTPKKDYVARVGIKGVTVPAESFAETAELAIVLACLKAKNINVE
jgi:hypothetical protein